MGATASTVRTYNEIASCTERGKTFIPIESVSEHLRMFQHQKDGEILILIDSDADAFLKDPNSSEYHEIFISRRGTQYLKKVSGALTFQATKALMEKSSDAPPVAQSRHGTPIKSLAGADGPVDGPDKELTLYQLHLREHPNEGFGFGTNTILPTISPRARGDKYLLNDSQLSGTLESDVKRSSPIPTTTASDSGAGMNSMSIDKESESVRFSGRPQLAEASASQSQSMETERYIGSAQQTESSSSPSKARAVSFLRQEQEALARARGESPQSGLDDRADAKSTPISNLSPRTVPRASPRMSPRPQYGDPIRSEFQTPVRQASPRPNLPRSGGTQTPRIDVAVGGNPPISENLSTAGADSKDSYKEDSETKQGDSNSSSNSGNSRNSTVASLPIKMREIVPIAYLPPSESHCIRIKEEEQTYKQFISRSSSTGHKSDEPGIDLSPDTRESFREASFRGLDAKFTQDSISAQRLSPRSSISTIADGKTPSLRTAYSLNASSVSTTALVGGIADLGSNSLRHSKHSVCPVCSIELIDSTNTSTSTLESHISTCRMRQEMKCALLTIDENLKPKLEELSEFNQTQMNLVYSTAIGRAAEEFDECANLKTLVKKIVKNVLHVTYDTSQKRIDRIQYDINAAQDRVIGHITQAEEVPGPHNTDSRRKINAFTQFLKILQQTAEKLSQKRKNIEQFKKFLVGVDDFQMLRKLGKGSFANVYLARLSGTKQVFAIKVLSKEALITANLTEQVLKERTALTMAKRYPDYFVQLHYCFQNTDNLFFVMDYMQGGDCLSLITSLKRLPEHVAQHLVAQVSVAVKHLHKHGVIHRDIKPDNVMITARGHAKLGDFGSVYPIHADFQRFSQPTSPGLVTISSGAGVSAAANGTAGAGAGGGLSSATHGTASGTSSASNKSVNANSSLIHNAAITHLSNPLKVLSKAMVQLVSEDPSGSASLALKHLTSQTSSASNSLWLKEEDESVFTQSETHTNNGSSNFSSSSTTSSLFFNKNGGGAQMQNTFDIVGNYFYASPEMASGSCIFNQSVDWWAVGVLLFHMLSGTTPFEGLTKAATLDNIEHMAADWDPLPSVSSGCKDFLKRILEHSYETRLGSSSSDEILSHEFFANIDFKTLYDGYGPYYPRLPHVEESSPDFYCFSLLSEAETLDVVQFSTRSCAVGSARKEGKSPRSNAESSRGEPVGYSRGTESSHSPREAQRDEPTNNLSPLDDLFQEFDYHPFG